MGTAVVSGSGSGIGASIVERLRSRGDRVIGIDLVGADIDADLSEQTGRDQAIAAAIEQAGGPIHRVVACAGIGPEVPDLARIASVNYFGAIRLLDGLRPAMEGAPEAAAVAISSNSAQMFDLRKLPYTEALVDDDEERAREAVRETNGFVAYAGAKYALARAVRQRAVEWAGVGVRLNAVCPGQTETPLLEKAENDPNTGQSVRDLAIPLGRRAKPAEIAGTVAFLLSSDASNIHGSVIFNDGGTDAQLRPDRF